MSGGYYPVKTISLPGGPIHRTFLWPRACNTPSEKYSCNSCVQHKVQDVLKMNTEPMVVVFSNGKFQMCDDNTDDNTSALPAPKLGKLRLALPTPPQLQQMWDRAAAAHFPKGSKPSTVQWRRGDRCLGQRILQPGQAYACRSLHDTDVPKLCKENAPVRRH